MGGLPGEANGSLVENKVEKETVNVQTNKGIKIGELLWVKLNEVSWWPAQIVDENLVSSANKPSSKGSSTEVLARIYGSYTYKYVDIPSSSAEFKSMLIKNNFNYYDILKKSLEQDLPSLSSSKSRKRQQSSSKGKVVNGNGSSDKSPVSSKRQKQEKPKTAESFSQIPEPKQTPDDSKPSTPNTELSARRVKVMQSLGLVAPSGSPFPRNLN